MIMSEIIIIIIIMTSPNWLAQDTPEKSTCSDFVTQNYSRERPAEERSTSGRRIPTTTRSTLRNHESFLIKVQFYRTPNLHEFRLTWLMKEKRMENKIFSQKVIIVTDVLRKASLCRRAPRSMSEELGTAVSFNHLTTLRLFVILPTKISP